jgi:hypothetical protein
MGYWGVVMQDLVYELPRKSILRTRVNNKGKKNGAEPLGPRPFQPSAP